MTRWQTGLSWLAIGMVALASRFVLAQAPLTRILSSNPAAVETMATSPTQVVVEGKAALHLKGNEVAMVLHPTDEAMDHVERKPLVTLFVSLADRKYLK